MRSLVFLLPFAVVLLLSCGGEPEAVQDPSGVWEGSLVGGGLELELKAVFSMQDGAISGTLDIPQQQARGLELTDITLAGDSLCFSLPSNLGTAEFRGIISGDTLRGDFLQSGFTGTYQMLRTSTSLEEPRLQGEDVTITGDDCVLAGTLTLPDGEPPYPCVVLLSGSGLQDRDEYVMGFPVFEELSVILDDAGYAVLRCDDRGVGGSTGGLESFSDSVLLYDAGLMLDHVMSDPRIDGSEIGLLGHSEGSNTAFRLAAERPEEVAFVISMAGPAVSGYRLIPSQLQLMLSMQGFTEEEIADKLQAQYLIMDAVLADDVSLIDSVLREQTRAELMKLPEGQLEALGGMEAYLDEVTAASVAQTLSPWFRSFLTADPAEYMRRVDVPVLCLLGELDTQVIPETNLGPMQDALAGNERHRIAVIEGANHLFQEAVSGSMEEYGTLEPEFTEGFRDTLRNWLEGLRAGSF